jgi:hypothetical protein
VGTAAARSCPASSVSRATSIALRPGSATRTTWLPAASTMVPALRRSSSGGADVSREHAVRATSSRLIPGAGNLGTARSLQDLVVDRSSRRNASSRVRRKDGQGMAAVSERVRYPPLDLRTQVT